MQSLIDEYAALLPKDTEACAALFAEDAEYVTSIGGRPVHLKGREAIRDFIRQVPRHLEFSAIEIGGSGPSFTARLKIEGPNFPAVVDRVRFGVVAGRIARFEVIPGIVVR